jgi:hypothetical protein
MNQRQNVTQYTHCADKQAGYHVGLPVGAVEPSKRKNSGILDIARIETVAVE